MYTTVHYDSQRLANLLYYVFNPIDYIALNLSSYIIRLKF